MFKSTNTTLEEMEERGISISGLAWVDEKGEWLAGCEAQAKAAAAGDVTAHDGLADITLALLKEVRTLMGVREESCRAIVRLERELEEARLANDAEGRLARWSQIDMRDREFVALTLLRAADMVEKLRDESEKRGLPVAAADATNTEGAIGAALAVLGWGMGSRQERCCDACDMRQEHKQEANT